MAGRLGSSLRKLSECPVLANLSDNGLGGEAPLFLEMNRQEFWETVFSESFAFCGSHPIVAYGGSVGRHPPP